MSTAADILTFAAPGVVALGAGALLWTLPRRPAAGLITSQLSTGA